MDANLKASMRPSMADKMRAEDGVESRAAREFGLGLQAFSERRLDCAREHMERAAAFQGRVARYQHGLGVILRELGEYREAELCFERALILDPGHVEAHYDWGCLLSRDERFEAAIPHFEAVLLLRDDFPQVRFNLGNALRKTGKLRQAEECYRNLAHREPRNANAQGNLGIVLRDQGRIDEALVHWKHAVGLAPENPEAHWNLAYGLLAKGEYARGWKEFEWRLKTEGNGLRQRLLTQPRWTGEADSSLTLLVHTEQGAGDSIQFARYIPLAAQRVKRLMLGCPRELSRLFDSLEGVHCLVVEGDPLPHFDCHVPLLSLPGVFETTLSSIPWPGCYLKPSGSHTNMRLPRLSRSLLRVGIVWSGNSRHANDRNRSTHLRDWLPLLSLPGTTFYSLQVGPQTSEMARLASETKMIPLHPWIGDFADTAHWIEQLDLVISVDTAVAHLAGAMNKRTWVMLPFSPDWRWLLDRQDSPWYPSLRLFRQPSLGDWTSVLTDIRGELERLIREKQALPAMSA
ncbi:MAG TPA: tetratricopeptide repeat-containing glycosyltransferase family protein [Candidatus Paceibacterota bacterium]|nr:tetratricopeptide repeat-containing glycosyltransferase family protein [Verrucomicrobiota bacterium]HRY48835.1 tetratricopeptide repeat-containing glycosyltransferase family protein [Candidatus Paceibacterota bacterium]